MQALFPLLSAKAHELRERPADDAPDGGATVQRRVGVLEHGLERAHLLGRALDDSRGQPYPGQLDRRARVGLGQTEKHTRERRLAAARLADEPDGLAGADVELDVDQGANLVSLVTEGLARMLEPDDGHVVRGSRRHDRRGARRARELRGLVVEVTAAEVPTPDRVEGRLVGVADLLCQAAAVGEDASGEGRSELRQVAGDRVQPVAVLAEAAPGNTAKEADRVGMTRLGEHRPGLALLDQTPGVEDADALAHPPDHAQVVADEEHARAELLAELGDEVENLGLDGRVQAGRRLVEDEERRVRRKRHRDHDALLRAAGELVGVAAHDAVGIGDLNLPQHLARPVEGFVLRGAHELEDLGDLVADTDRRVQRGSRILVDHRQGRSSQSPHLRLAHAEEVDAVGADRAGHNPAVPREVAHDREGRGGLAAPRLADEPVRLALLDRKREPTQHRPVDPTDAVHDLELLDLKCGLGHRSKVWAITSAMRLIPTISVAIASEGKRTAHQTPALMN